MFVLLSNYFFCVFVDFEQKSMLDHRHMTAHACFCLLNTVPGHVWGRLNMGYTARMEILTRKMDEHGHEAVDLYKGSLPMYHYIISNFPPLMCH